MEENEERTERDPCCLAFYIFLLFLLLSPGNNNNSEYLRNPEEVKLMNEVKKSLGEKLDIDYGFLANSNIHYAYNISGIYLGDWKYSNDTTIIPKQNITLGATEEITRLPSNSTIRGREGKLSLQLFYRSPYRKNISIFKGILTLIEGEQDSTDDSFSVDLIGFYFLSTGNLVLYSSSNGIRFHVDWTSTPATSHMHINNSYSYMVGYSTNNTNRLYLSYPTQYINESSYRCLYRMNMKMKELPEGVDPEISHHKHNHYLVNSTGILESENCNDRIVLSFGGNNMDTHHITQKARIYTISMIILSFIECSVYIQILQQLVLSSATGVSLLFVYCLAAIDLLLAMIHSLAGVLFMGLLSEIYFVSFQKFFMFSIVEIRVLYFVWHSRHPIINENNATMFQRQLSSIFSSLYILVIIAIIVMYSNKTVFFILIMVLYSFWLPQIIRSLQVGQRPPFSIKHILSITFLKLFVPLYLFACPFNIVNMFTDIEINYKAGWILICWVLVQVC